MRRQRLSSKAGRQASVDNLLASAAQNTTAPVALSPSPGLFDLRKTHPLPREFFNRDTRQVARELLGKLLIRRHGERILAGRIVETEAYLGVDDHAAHAAAGRTARNAVLFGPPGFAYIYLIYGNHYCLNVSCLPDGEAGGVLFRALEPVAGLAEMARLRHVELSPAPRATQLRQLTSGPGRLAHAFAITRLRDNGKDMTSPRRSDLWLADDGYQPARIAETPRIGITKAVDHPLRYIVAGSQLVSGKRVS
ncbi:MAG TPA: DNA-3-methyladenine glycosylase [Clostridia bacterium]|nr:DNA-3-methyladenine glycosylase [Clostridia bacterium]